MKSKSIFITAKEWFEGSSLRNPVAGTDHKLEQIFPDFYCVSYDTKLLATKEEKQSLFEDDYRKRFGTNDICALDAAIVDCGGRYVFLNGFDQEQFSYIAPKIKDTAEILYLFKCPRIHDLSVLSQFSKIKCVHIFWNNSLECLWDMTGNKQLKVISFAAISKLNRIETLKYSGVEYISLDSADNNGHTKKALFDTSVFEQMPQLKHLSLNYSACKVDY